MGKLFRIYNVNPFDAAQEVVSHWADKASIEAGQWAANYEQGVRNAASDPRRLQEAALKLGAWYAVLRRKAPEIARIYEELKREYLAELGNRNAAIRVSRPRLVEVQA